MLALMPRLPPTPGDAAWADPARRAFRWALGWFLAAALLGVLLRASQLPGGPRIAFGHWLHAHSHTAFLGFVFNGFFAIALAVFVPGEKRENYTRLFVVMQVAVLGMLATFPWQGYGPASIAFSTLHMGAAVMFARRLWRDHEAGSGARAHLGAALVCLLASGAGPLALGPLAAAGLRDSPAYALAIYFYLHANYNGWFPFFLQASVLRATETAGIHPARDRAARLSLRWMAAGAVLTFAQSTLWLGPPGWVFAVAGAGGAAQLVGFVWWLRALGPLSGRGLAAVRALGSLSLVCHAAKLLLQTASAWPALAPLAGHRFVVIAFLHLVFLGVVTAALFAWALRLGWLRDSPSVRLCLGVFFVAAAVSEALLVGTALGWASAPILPGALCAAAVAMALALVPLVLVQR